MRIVQISSILRRLGIKLPEFALKEELVRFLVETKSERIVEIPLVLGNLPTTKATILDVGCRYSLLSIQLASLGHKVYGLDINPYTKEHPNFIFNQGDILKPPYKKAFFDMAISLSTIEHIGLGVYGDTNDGAQNHLNDADQRAAKSIYNLLKPGGSFILTVPFGKPITSAFQRVYDTKRLNDLLKPFRIKSIEVFKADNGYWMPSSPKEGEQVDSSQESHAIAFVVASKKR